MKLNYIVLILFLLFFSSCKTVVVEKQTSKMNRYSTLSDYGIIPNDSLDDAAGIQKLINEGSKEIYLPSGVYLLNKSVQLPNDIFVSGSPNTIFKANKKMEYMFYMDKPYHKTENFQLNNLIFDGNNKAQYCLYLYKLCYPTPSILKGVRCKNAIRSGAFLKACQAAKVDGLSCHNNGENGLILEGCNGLTLYSLSVRSNKGNGLLIKSLKEKEIVFSGGLALFGMHSEQNLLNGVSLQNISTPVSFYAGWIEGNTMNGMAFLNSHANLDGMRISGNLDVAKNIYPINIYKDQTTSGSKVIVDNCFIVNNKGLMTDINNNNDEGNLILRNKRKYNFIVK